MGDEVVKIEPVETITDEITEVTPAPVEKKDFGVLGKRLNYIIEKGASEQKAVIESTKKVEPVVIKPDDEIPTDENLEHTDERKKGVRLEDRSVSDLVGEVRKWMSIAEKRKVDIERGEPNQKYTKFIDDMRKDFYHAYETHAEEFGLPDISYLKSQISTSGDKDTRIEQWQNTELIPAIERKFRLEPGTFVSDPQDLYKKGTPTEMFRRETEYKEREIDREYGEKEQLKATTVQRVAEQQQKDIDFLKKNYYIDEEEKFNLAMDDFNSLADRLSKGEVSEEKNPFAIRNIFRGIYFNELADALIKKAESNLHKQYNDLGLYLPESDRNTPTDVTSVKGSPLEIRKGPANKYSQQSKIFSRYSQ